MGVVCECAVWVMGCRTDDDIGAEADARTPATTTVATAGPAAPVAPAGPVATTATTAVAGQPPPDRPRPSAIELAEQLCDELGEVVAGGGDVDAFLSVAVVGIAARLNDPHARDVPALAATPQDAAYFFIGSCPDHSLPIDGFINARAETEDPTWRTPVPP